MNQIFVFEGKDKDGQGWLVQKREEFASNKIGECPRYRYDVDLPNGTELELGKDFRIEEKEITIQDNYGWVQSAIEVAIPIKPEQQEQLSTEEIPESEVYALEFSIDNLTKETYDEWIGKLKDAGFKPKFKKSEAISLPDAQLSIDDMIDKKFKGGNVFAENTRTEIKELMEEYKQSNGEVERLTNENKALTAIKKGLETSLSQAFSILNKRDWKECRCDVANYWCFVHHKWGGKTF